MHIDGKSCALGAGLMLAFNMCSSSEVRNTASVVVSASRDAAIRVLSSIGSQPKREKAASRVDSAPSASAPAAPAPSGKK